MILVVQDVTGTKGKSVASPARYLLIDDCFVTIQHARLTTTTATHVLDYTRELLSFSGPFGDHFTPTDTATLLLSSSSAAHRAD
jgi:hypothetical protein